MTTDKSYLSCAETAKLVRTALKYAFPGVKFSVRSDNYAGGASIRIHWTDGPTKGDVDAIAGRYAGADFDGMQDLKYHHTHWLMPDGSVTLAAVHHNMEPKSFPKPHPDARPVSFGADFVFAERTLSHAFRVKIAERALREFGLASYVPADTKPEDLVGPTDRYAEWSSKVGNIHTGSCWATDLLYRASVHLRGDGTATHDANGASLLEAGL